MLPRKQDDIDERLSRLIQLKRREKPDAEYWSKFEQNFRSRQLSALVETQPWHSRAFIRLKPYLRNGAAAAGVASAIALVFVANTRSGLIASKDSSETEQSSPSSPPPLFVVADSAQQAEATLTPFAHTANAIYSMSVLSNRNQPENYTLISSPLILSASSHEAEESNSALGAKIIRASNPF